MVSCVVSAQRNCLSSEYLENQMVSQPFLTKKINEIESFIEKQKPTISLYNLRTSTFTLIRIPVVVHVLYNTPDQNISDAQIKSQIEVLNKDFRRQNSDSVATPTRFKSLAADVQIEFYLATADPRGKSTNGIVRKKTNTTAWLADDKIKLSAEGGDNAWDAKSYLNIWVGNLKSGLGYATVPGSELSKDGLVIKNTAFGTINAAFPYNLGRTAVHEIGHWLGLKHTWGDTYCGDDMVADTPPQSGYTAGCPTGFRSSCTNGSTGDMYMNYMDYTNDACVNLFTEGQKQRMRSLFNNGGARASLLASKGLHTPWVEEAATETETIVKQAKMYPNPATAEVTLNFENDETWVGKKLEIFNVNGVLLQSVQVSSKTQKIGIASLKPGIYFIKGVNGSNQLLQKLIKF